MRVIARRLSGLRPETILLGQGILAQRRDALARGITLIESSREDHRRQASQLLSWLAGQSTSDKTFRIGVAGPPGAGKSTFIEALGMRFVSQSNKVAVIPVDPSSHISGGSILGDKTRMEQLSRSDQAYVRASPTRGVLGGIAEHTADVIFLCETAGYNIVFVESVGLGQSEVDIDSAVDMLLVLVPPGGGDGLQASKKGIMEAADLVVVNKADGHLLAPAKHTRADYQSALAFIRRKHPSWQPSVLLVSARTGDSLETVEAQLRAFRETMVATGALQRKRANQAVHWMWGQFRRAVASSCEKDARVLARAQQLEQDIAKGTTTARAAADALFDAIRPPQHSD
jgi:LAO/AO transport system kinase